MSTPTLHLLGLTRGATIAAAEERLGVGAGLAARIYRDAHHHGRFAPRALGAAARTADEWQRHFTLDGPAISRVIGDHGTQKAVLTLADGLEVETVRIPMGDRGESQCVSSQVGCAMACTFCETGLMGRLRHLAPSEIVAQLVLARRDLGWNPRRIVFQGMGEPLDAFDSVAEAIDVLCDPGGGAWARDRITLCTAGHVAGLRRLAARGIGRLNLSLSLNVADDERRATLMPIARSWSLRELQAALIEIRPRRNWQLGVHVCLMPAINDSRADARAIAAFCAPLGRVMLHLIPYNPGTRPITRTPTEMEVVRFVGWLRDEGLPVRRRVTKGRDLGAACGQLGNLSQRRTPTRTGHAGIRVFPDQDSNLD